MLFDVRELEHKSDKLTQLLKITIVIAIAVAIKESQLQGYPVSYYDYLFIFIVKIYPFFLKNSTDLLCDLP